MSIKDNVKFWLSEIEASEKRLKTWRKSAKENMDMYSGLDTPSCEFNILFSNTETLLPALYSNTPKVKVRRRYDDNDPVGKIAAEVCERTVNFLCDSGDPRYQNFSLLSEQGVLHALLTGRGLPRWKYDARMEALPEPDDVTQNADTSSEDGNLQSPTTPKGEYETVWGEFIYPDRFNYGYAKNWATMPWIGIEHRFTKSEIKDNFGAAIAEACTYGIPEGMNANTAKTDPRRLAIVHEIWDKASKKVYFVSENLKDKYLRDPTPDPLELRGFFPVAEPLHLLPAPEGNTPIVPYDLYKTQAEELYGITRRIRHLIKMMKIRGFYDERIAGLKDVLDAEEGTLIAASGSERLLQGQKLDNSIWLMPLDQIINVLNQLLSDRESIKRVIYEITGMGDIIRGSSVASETATAQGIKDKWGTLRLKRMQSLVQIWCRNNLRLVCELAMKHFSKETIAAITLIDLPTNEQKKQIQIQLQQMMQMAPPGGQPPPQAAAMQATLAKPSWEDVLKLIQDDHLGAYRLDIETNSTLMDEIAEDQKDLTDLLNAFGQAVNSLLPLVEQGLMPFEAAKAIMLGIIRKTSLGTEVEEEFEKMQPPAPPAQPAPPPPPPVDPNIQLQQQADAAKLQQQMQADAAEHDFKMKELAAKESELNMKMQVMQVTTMSKLAAAKPHTSQGVQ